MLDDFWAVLKEPANRAVLGWIGAGIVVVASGLWAVVKFYTKKDKAGSTPNVRADDKSVAAGGNISNSPINIDTRHSGKR